MLLGIMLLQSPMYMPSDGKNILVPMCTGRLVNFGNVEGSSLQDVTVH